MTKPKRNDPCHCGSGKKYKHCHLKEDRAQERAEAELERESEEHIAPFRDDMPSLPAGLFKDAFAKPDYGPPPTTEEIVEVLDSAFATWRTLEENASDVTETPEVESTETASTTDAVTVVANDAGDEVMINDLTLAVQMVR